MVTLEARKMKMNYAQKQAFLMQVAAMVEAGEVTIAELVATGTKALEDKCARINDLRVEAEFALTMIVDLVPASKHAKHAVAMTKAKKVLVNSGAFNGTEMAKRLASEIGMTDGKD
jgi:hypothetical protein